MKKEKQPELNTFTILNPDFHAEQLMSIETDNSQSDAETKPADESLS